ncbi:TPA_asm: coat protein [ssRNA phage SRR7976310_4]|uniref:Coat protein n=1 Tax=ssRNA phage SRR7976310_4 TaxID=2786682 RepID=A0A8S5L0J8_9VIRU|nr:coat protein [ssRNA phage SRR7976310_4]DAD51136.1 TPA_asm: coat protein [ssRNA phage SRR7976310_4]
MAKSIVYNRTDTAIPGVPSLTIPIGLVNYGADFAVKENSPGQAILTNLTSPTGREEKFRFAMSDIKDVYRNSNIDPSVYAPSRRGISVLSQLVDTWTIIDSNDPSYEVSLPMEGHIVLKIPANENITADMVLAFVGRVCSGLFNTGVNTSERLRAMLRGSLLPTDV